MNERERGGRGERGRGRGKGGRKGKIEKEDRKELLARERAISRMITVSTAAPHICQHGGAEPLSARRRLNLPVALLAPQCAALAFAVAPRHPLPRPSVSTSVSTGPTVAGVHGARYRSTLSVAAGDADYAGESDTDYISDSDMDCLSAVRYERSQSPRRRSGARRRVLCDYSGMSQSTDSDTRSCRGA
jgi:hypothetical protein